MRGRPRNTHISESKAKSIGAQCVFCGSRGDDRMCDDDNRGLKSILYRKKWTWTCWPCWHEDKSGFSVAGTGYSGFETDHDAFGGVYGIAESIKTRIEETEWEANYE